MYTRQAEGAESRFATPWGEGVVTVRDGRLVGVDLPTTAGREEAAARAPGAPVPAESECAARAQTDRAAADGWAEQLESYFRGERLRWTSEEVGLDDLAVGAFARGVYATLLTVPPAVTVSYGDLAEMAGHPRAARAVGTAMAGNPIPIVIPCHRVIRSDGSLGNYGDDPALKERLLAHEREHSPAPGGERC
jgi:methylated-DNA-[protein]-cysteine S-methyltransferase